MKWLKRGAKILATFVTGYSGGLALVFPLATLNDWQLQFYTLLFFPMISGFIVALPQISKVLFEYANME